MVKPRAEITLVTNPPSWQKKLLPVFIASMASGKTVCFCLFYELHVAKTFGTKC